MEKFCVKGYLKRSGKRVLSIFLCACMIGTMIPITARAETEETSMPSNDEVTCTCANLCTEDKVNSDCPVCGAEEADLSKCTGKVQSENNENQLNTGESEEEKNETELTITAWEWIDEEELINPETGILALPFANEETPAFFDDVVALLPTQIQATVVNEEDIKAEAASETITLGDWSCEEYPKEGAYSGSYTFAAALPEGCVLSEEAKALTVLVELGGAQMYETGGGETVGAFTVTGGTKDRDYTYADGVLTIISNTPITIRNTDPSIPTSDRIEVARDFLADITLAGVNIDVSSNSGTAAFKIADDRLQFVYITLADDSVNTLKSGSNCAGLQMNKYLYIKGEGKLIATGGDNGAGIGGGDHGKVSNIRIMGGTVIATGSGGGAGIGGGNGGKGSDIYIFGGTVTATGSGGGAGIGGGNNYSGSSIRIMGGTVNATGSGGGAGIGGGCNDSGSIIIIKGGTVTATGSGGGAGIGGGFQKGGSGITISGGTVTATGGSNGGVGIGGGNNYSGSDITITGGTVTATGSGGGAGIGGVVDSGSGITMEGDAVLYTSSINGEHTFTKGVVYDGVTVSGSGDAGSYTLTGGVGTVYSNPNVSGFTKPTGSKLGTNLADADCITVTVPDVDYTGAEAVLTATVTVDKIALGGTKTLVQGTDYTVSVSSEDKTNAGAKTATITAVANSGNVGEITGNAFNVKPVDLSADKIKMTLPGIPETGYVYDSNAKEPVPVVTLKQADDSEYTLIKDTDYTVSYSNNTDAYELLSRDEGYEADKAPTVKITAKDGGNFTGSRSMNFNILLADMPEFTITPYSDSYDGEDHKVVSITPADGFTDYVVNYSTDNKVTWSTTMPTITDAGTLDFYVKATKANYKDWISEKQTAKVTPVALDSSMISFNDTNHYYTGQEVKPKITVKDSNRTLMSGTDYTVSYTNNTSVSTESSKAKVTITAANGNYTGSASAEFNIEYANEEYMNYCTVSGTEGKDGWYSSDVTIQNKADTNSAWGALQFSGSPTGAFADSYTVSAEGETDVTIWFKQTKTGYIGSDATTVKIDKTAPTWTDDGGISIKTNKWKSLLSTISFGLFYKETVDVTVSASDSLSGVAKYYYYVDTSAGETVKTKEELDALANGESGFTECAATDANATQKIASLSDDKNYVVYVYAVDKAGNKSDYICSNGVVIDKTSPIISNISTPSKGSGEDATLTDTKADMTFTASESGTYFYIVKESSEDAPDAINDFATSLVDESTGMTVWTANEGVTADAMTADNSNKLSLTGLTANTAYTVYVIGVDRAGNASDVLSKEFTTCKTMPEVTTNPTLSGTYGTAVSAMTLEKGVAKAGDTVIDGTWTLTDANASDVPGVGTSKTYEVTFTPADTYNGQYETVKVSVKPTVEHKAVTVTAENKSKTYGQENPELTFTVPEGSLVGLDTVEALGVTLSCEATKTSPVKEGGYAITGTSSSANYDVTVTPGILTINQATAEITVGTESYSKTFGDAAFDLSVTDNNTDEGADVTYAVSDSKNAAGTSVDNDKVITVDASGKVTIVGAGSATITASLAASNNFTAATSKTITVTVAKKTGYTVSDIQESYLYSKDTDESIDLSKYIPADCGNVVYGTPQTTDDLFTSEGAPAITDGKLTYTVKQAATFGATGTITVTVSSDNYADFDITVSLKLIDKIPVKLQSGSSVSLVSNTLTYGKALSTLTFNKAVFVDGTGTEVAGTLDWTDKTMKPAVAVTSAAWKFTPENSDYATVEGNLTIKVEKAEPNVKVLPTVADRIYHPNAKLADTDLILTEASVLDVNGQKLSGTWKWKTADVIPTVNNSGYEAEFTPDDTDNYKTITKTITVNVTKATPYIETAPTAAAITYGKTLADATLTGGSVQYSSEDTTAVDGIFAWKVDTTKPAVADSNTTAYKVVFTPTNKNYNTVEKDITVTVNKAASAPGLPNNTMEVDYSKEKVSDITTLPEGWAWKDADKDTALTVGTAVAATAVYTGADAGNYETESVEISITRQKCAHDGETEVVGAVEATCKEDGFTGDTKCKDCGETLIPGTVIDKLTTHSYVNGVCSVCDDIFKTTVDGVTYQVMTETGADGKPVGKLVTVSGNEISQVAVAVIGTGDNFAVSDGKVTVPSEITGSGSEQTFVVTKIAEDAFSGVSVTEIVIPATVTEVGTGAFGTASTITFKGNTAPSGIAGAITETVTTVNVPEGAADSYREELDENANIVEAHTHTFDTKWTYDETYHWHAATCGHAEEVSDKAVHTFGEWTVTKEATEDAEGVKERSCSCGYKETAKIDKLAHTIHVKDEGTRVEPACEKKGSITYKCTKCGEVMEVEELDATGHKWDAGKVTKEATETAEGVKTYTCSVCGKTKTEAIPKKEATTPQPPKKGDVVKDDKTSVKVEVSDVKKKEVEYKEPANKKAKTVSIPATVKIDGVTYKVTKIDDNAFKNNKTVTKVTVGSNIKTIGKSAFSGATKLKTVKIGKNVTEVGANAFKGCSSLTSVTLPSKATKIGANAFNGCKKLKTIKITSTKLSSKTVSKNAFKGLTKATTIKVPKKKLSAYKKLFKQKGLSSKVKVKGY